MYRKFSNVLQKWAEEKTKEPLLVTGARQVGKTWLIDRFCRERYGEDYLYLNFERDQDLGSAFESSLDPAKVLQTLSVLTGKRLSPKTAIFLDEIQRSEKAITALKYFCEAEENYRIIAAGSLLGVKLKRFESSFPVGKVQIRQMYPMDFEEFLLAAGQELLRDAILEAYGGRRPLPDAVHNRAIRYYRDYLFIGGMPRCVLEYTQAECDVNRFDGQIQQDILTSYVADMSKYTFSAAESAKIAAVYESIPSQLAREDPKFRYREIRQNANRRDFYEPIDWLIASGMVYRVQRADLPQSPLKAFANPAYFKLYLSDAGLLAGASGIKYRDLLPEANSLYKGVLAENYVAQALAAKGQELYYFKPDPGMEIDLLLNGKEGIIPVEIKAGRHKRSTSLKNYMEKYKPAKAIRVSENNFGETDGLTSVPLYSVFAME